MARQALSGSARLGALIMPFVLSMRTSLWLTLSVMGMLAMVLAVATGSVYSELTLTRQVYSLSELIKLKTNDLLKQLEHNSFALATDIQYDAKFRAAMAAGKPDVMRLHLDNEFHRFYATSSLMQIQKFFVLDTNYNIVSESSDSEGSVVTGKSVLCEELIFLARHRRGAERLKPLSSICYTKDAFYYAVLAPVGGLRPLGYIVVITNPVYTLQKLIYELGMPVRITKPDGSAQIESAGWPEKPEMNKYLIAEYSISNQTNSVVMKVAMASDMKSLHEDLVQVRNMVLIFAGLITAIIGILFLVLLQRTTLTPLNKLVYQIHRVLSDRSSLGEQVTATGVAEIKDLSESFNKMTVELKDLYDTLDKLAFSDPLTGLPNRTLFNDRMNQTILICRRQRMRFALLMMDLDRFKQVNDTLGHVVGDELLKQVSARLHGCLRKSDTLTRLREDSLLARLGGDEFAALLPMVGAEDMATTVAQRLQSVMNSPFYIGENHFSIGISIGVAMYPDNGEDAITLMRHADLAMYEAKRTLKGLVFYTHQDDELNIAQLTLESDFRSAFDRDELEVFFQPKVDSKTQAVCGAEALLRWQHPIKGIVPPSQFIMMAEQSGMMQILAYYVLDKSLEQCALWHRSGYSLSVSVNISAQNLRDNRIVNDIKNLLNKWNMNARVLCLELTESAFMIDPEQAIKILNALHDLGVCLSIDDFGTGYSSLTYLQKLPVDEVKIDKSFVIGMDLQHNDNVIVRSTIDLAHNMNLRVVAEGVETVQVAEMLKRLRCEVMQGDYFSRPIPAIDFFRHLSDSRWQITTMPERPVSHERLVASITP